MNRAGVMLLLLLVLQSFGTVMLYRADGEGTGTLAPQTLVNAGPFVIDELRVEDSMGGSVQLRKVGDLWLLPELGNLPAKSAMVENVLQKLTIEDPGWSIAHTLASRQRFQVAHYHYRLRVTLVSLNQPVGTVYLGTSPGFRKVHARNDKLDNIYSVDLNLYDLPAQPGKWLEPRLLQIRAPMQITADGYSLERGTGEWRMGTGAKPDQRELQALLDSLRNLQVQGVAAEETRQEISRLEADLILQVTGLAGEVELQLFKFEQQHFISSSEYPLLFTIAAYDFDKLTGIDSFLLSGAQ